VAVASGVLGIVCFCDVAVVVVLGVLVVVVVVVVD
jgi:hypothetical protein